MGRTESLASLNLFTSMAAAGVPRDRGQNQTTAAVVHVQIVKYVNKIKTCIDLKQTDGCVGGGGGGAMRASITSRRKEEGPSDFMPRHTMAGTTSKTSVEIGVALLGLARQTATLTIKKRNGPPTTTTPRSPGKNNARHPSLSREPPAQKIRKEGCVRR